MPRPKTDPELVRRILERLNAQDRGVFAPPLAGLVAELEKRAQDPEALRELDTGQLVLAIDRLRKSLGMGDRDVSIQATLSLTDMIPAVLSRFGAEEGALLLRAAGIPNDMIEGPGGTPSGAGE